MATIKTMATTAPWRDVTSLCQQAASECTHQDPMITVADFSLFDAMSAVELMDPKMDQCYGVTCSIQVETLLRATFPATFTLGTARKILQSLFVHETSFLDGASYLESTHQCVFMWEGSWADVASRSPALPERVLLAFVKSLDRSLMHVNSSVLTADIYEDEDYQVTHKPVLSQDLPADEVLAEAEAVADVLHAQVGAADADGEVRKLATLMRCRCQLQRFYAAVDKWSYVSVSTATKVRTGQLAAVDRAHLAELCADAKAAAEGLAAALDAVAQLFNNSGGSSSDSSDDMGSHRDHPDIAFAYNEVLVKVMQSSAIRAIPVKPFSRSIAHFQDITKQVLKVCVVFGDLSAAAARGTLDFEDMLHVAANLSGDRLHLLSRSLFLGAVYSWMPRTADLVLQAMHRRGLPPDLIGTADAAADGGSRVQDWVHMSVSRVAWDTLKALMVNRNRLPSKLESLLQTWSQVTQEALYLDADYHHQCLAADAAGDDMALVGVGEDRRQPRQFCVMWTMISTHLLMDMHMSLTVENELLGRDELAYFYWYWDFLSTTRGFAMDTLRTLRVKRESAAQHKYIEQRMKQIEVAQGKKGKAKAPGAAAAAAEQPPLVEPPEMSEPVISIEEIVVRSRGYVCRGLFRMFVLAQELGLVRRHDERYMSMANKFYQRFSAFQDVPHAPRVTYEDFVRVVVAIGGSTHALCSYNSSSGSSGDVSESSGDGNNNSNSNSSGSEDTDCLPIVENASICFTNARKYVDEIKKHMPGAPPDGDNALSLVAEVAASTALTTSADQVKMCYRRVADLFHHRAVLPLTKVVVAASVSALKVIQMLKAKAAALPPPPPPPQTAAAAAAAGATGIAVSSETVRKAFNGKAILKVEHTHHPFFPVLSIVENS